MKKILLSGILAMLCATMVTNTVRGQSVEEGTIIIEPYYGWPDLLRVVMQATASVSDADGLRAGGYGPAGLRFEYMVSDKIGLGFDANYSHTFLSWTDPSITITPYTYSWKIDRIRAMAKMNVHFATTESLDPYFGVGAGYKHVNSRLITNDPNYSTIQLNNLIPVALRLSIGTRYFFTDNLGGMIEFGLGGPLLAGGVAVKF